MKRMYLRYSAQKDFWQNASLSYQIMAEAEYTDWGEGGRVNVLNTQ